MAFLRAFMVVTYYIKLFLKGVDRHNSTLKVVSTTFLQVCFLNLKESTCETRKNVFYFTSIALFVLFVLFRSQMPLHRQMPKHEIRNTFY